MNRTTTKIPVLRTQILIVIFVVLTSALKAQDSISIKGLVLSQDKMPISEVAVSIAGSIELPVITDEEGKFEIKASSTDRWLMVSPPRSYKEKTVYINGRYNITIYLASSDLEAGDDILSLMSRPVKRRDMVSSVSELNIQNMKNSYAMSVDQYMTGRVAGLQATNISGLPGSGAVLTLRGLNSINATNQPLFVVDGIPMASQDVFGSNVDGFVYNPMMEINTFDISKVAVVKDAVIKAAYGSKASNGVIFIETLDPAVTETTIDIDFRGGYLLKPDRQISQLNAAQHRTLISEVLFSSDYLQEEILEAYPNLFLEEEDDRFIDYQHNTNWQDYIYDNSVYTNFNIDVKGGDGIARYGLAFGYTDGNGTVRNTHFEGYNLRFVSLLNIFTWLKMDARVSLNYNNSSLKAAATSPETSPILTSLAKSPMLNPYQYDYDGNELEELSEVDELGVSNPLGTVENYEAKNVDYNFVATMGFTGTINRNMFVKSNFSLGYNVLKELMYLPNLGMELYANDEAINMSVATNNSLNNFYNNTYLNYSTVIGNDHVINSMTGLHLQTNAYQYDWGLTKNAHENDQYRNLQDGASDLREIGGENRNWNWMSLYETVNYSYKDRYLASASLSFDGSSRLGDNAANTLKVGGVPYGLFYSLGLGWRLSNESFLKDVDMIEELKLRLSYGHTGNDDIGEASATRYYNAIKFRETVGLYPACVPNDELSYETMNQMNIGLDYSMFGNRFNVSFDYYISKTNDMLIYSPISGYFGYDILVKNGGAMTNVGWDLNTVLRIIDHGRFKWDMAANLSSVKNQITEFEGGELTYSIPGAEKINRVGEEAYSFYGYIFNGVYSTQAEANEAGLVNSVGLPFQAGDAIYEDLSGPGGSPDGVINHYDKTIIGSVLPDLNGGIANTLIYGRFSLDVGVQFVLGNDVFNYVRYKNESMTGLENQSTAVLNRWQYDGQETTIPRAQWDDPMGNSDFSTRWIEDGSFLRLRNITLSYRLKNEWLAFKSVEAYVSANNLLTLSRYLGYDPEFAYSHSMLYMGVDYGQMPHPRQFMIGVKLGL